MIDFAGSLTIIISALLRAREGMGPVISRQPHPGVKVPIPTGSSHSPADEVCVSLCVRQRDFFMAENRGLYT